MTRDMLKKLTEALDGAQQDLAKLTPKERAQLEESWDVEHAYYSSALEGSDIDRKDVEKLAAEAF